MPHIIFAEPLAQMIRSITLQKRTGILRVEQLGGRGAERGEIYFENGSLLRARTERATGKAALQHIGEWKQITCAFQSMSRPYPVTDSPSASEREAEEESEPTHVLPQTDRLARMPMGIDPEQRTHRASQQRSLRDRNTHPLSPRQTGGMRSVNTVPALLPLEASAVHQPLVLHGTKLEAYTPVPVATPSRSVQRWTTHLLPEEPPVVARHPPATPRLLPFRGNPGRMAVFKSRAAVSPAQAIQQMERHARVIFILLDERRTIQDIARLTHQTEYDVEQILVDLTQRGYTQYVRG